MAEFSLGAFDFIIFLSIVLISILQGLYQAVFKRKKDSSSNYFTGDRKIGLVPVSMSLAVSFMSSVIMLGYPAEFYHFGSTASIQIATIVIGFPLAGWMLAPVMHSLNVTSAYEYLEMRFQSKPIRVLGAVLGTLQNVIYSGVVMFGPSVAIHAVTGFSTYGTILILAISAVLYTTVGGFTAVIWTDVFQLVTMVLGLLVICIKSATDVGDFGELLEINIAGKRLRPPVFNPDPTVRTSFWTSFIGGIFMYFSFAVSQQSVQRIAAMKTPSQAKRLFTVSLPASYIVQILLLFEAMAAYSYYTKKRCDPYTDGAIKGQNAIFPYYVLEICRDLPGLPGLFSAALFSASLSSISSNLNGISAIALKDLILPYYPNLTDRRSMWIARLLVVSSGAAAMVMAILIGNVKGPIMQIISIVLGSVNGPNSVLLVLGMFFPWINPKGIFTGVIAGLGMTYWVAFGATTIRVAPLLPALSDHCGVNASLSDMNVTEMVNVTSLIHDLTAYMKDDPVFTDLPYDGWGLNKLYAMSYTLFPAFSMLVTSVVAIIVSLLTGRSNPADVDPRCISPVVRNYFYKNYQAAETIPNKESYELDAA